VRQVGYLQRLCTYIAQGKKMKVCAPLTCAQVVQTTFALLHTSLTLM